MPSSQLDEQSDESIPCKPREFVIPNELANLSPDMLKMCVWMHNEVVGRLSRLDHQLERLTSHMEGCTKSAKEPKYGSMSTPSARATLRKNGCSSPEATHKDAHIAPVTPRRLPTLLQTSPFQKNSDERKPTKEGSNISQVSDANSREGAFLNAHSGDERKPALDRIDLSPTCEVNLCQHASLRLPSGDLMDEMIDAPRAFSKTESVMSVGPFPSEWSTCAVGAQNVEETCSLDQASMKSSHCSQTASWQRRPSQTTIESQKDLAALVQSRVGWKWREEAWTFLDDVESSKAAAKYKNGMVCFTLLSVVLSLMQAVESPPLEGREGAILESCFESIFLIEFLLRLSLCPDRSMFFRDIHNVCDFAAAAPLVLRLAVGFSSNFSMKQSGNTFASNMLISVVPVLRVLKTLRAFKHFHLIVRALSMCLEALPICLFSMFVLTLAFAAAIFMVEPRENINSLHHAMWLTIVTMTTLGYGDVLPSTTAGSLVVALVVVSSVMYMAMPLAIIGQAFSEVWRDRDRILLVHGVGSRLLHWGYKATDIPAIFQVFDEDDSGELRFPEFKNMIEEMHIGLSEMRILHLFQSIDCDGSGSIDDKEFVNALFPQYFKQIYEDEEQSDVSIEPTSPLPKKADWIEPTSPLPKKGC